MAQRTERAVLNHLIELCSDGERGFHSAADHVADPTLKALFAELAEQRRLFAAELVPHAQRLGGDAAADGTTAGSLHRGWISVREKVLGHHDHAVVVEAERGEHAAHRAYLDALNEVLAPATRELVERQAASVAAAYERVRAAANSAAAAK